MKQTQNISAQNFKNAKGTRQQVLCYSLICQGYTFNNSLRSLIDATLANANICHSYAYISIGDLNYTSQLEKNVAVVLESAPSESTLTSKKFHLNINI